MSRDDSPTPEGSRGSIFNRATPIASVSETSIFNRAAPNTGAPRTSIFNRVTPPGATAGAADSEASIFPRGAPAPPLGQRAAPPEEEEKPVTEKPNTISITVRDGQNTQSFRMKRDRPLHKLMAASALGLGKDLKSCRFMLDGQRITGDSTPEKLEMEDEDIIEIFTEQIGGTVRLLLAED